MPLFPCPAGNANLTWLQPSSWRCLQARPCASWSQSPSWWQPWPCFSQLQPTISVSMTPCDFKRLAAGHPAFSHAWHQDNKAALSFPQSVSPETATQKAGHDSLAPCRMCRAPWCTCFGAALRAALGASLPAALLLGLLGCGGLGSVLLGRRLLGLGLGLLLLLLVILVILLLCYRDLLLVLYRHTSISVMQAGCMHDT